MAIWVVMVWTGVHRLDRVVQIVLAAHGAVFRAEIAPESVMHVCFTLLRTLTELDTSHSEDSSSPR